MSEHLLITGATAALGSRLLKILLTAAPGRTATAIARDPSRVMRSARVRAVRGDVSERLLGLSATQWNELAGEVTGIIHCAADTRFGLPVAQARRVNAGGTREVISFAERAPGLAKFLHVSTTFVMGRDSGVLAEGEYSNRSGFVNSYEQAKYEAECEVFAKMRQLPASIVRPASLTGTPGGFIEQTLRLIPRNPLQVIPADPSATLDMVPLDWAAEAIAVLYDRCFSAGTVHNVCAGAPGAIKVGEAIEIACRRMGAVRTPTAVDLKTFEAYREHTLSNGERGITKALLQSVSHFLPHLAIRQSFRNDATIKMLAQHGLHPLSSRSALTEVLDRLAHVPVPASEAMG